MKYVIAKENGEIVSEGESLLTISEIQKFMESGFKAYEVNDSLYNLQEYAYKENTLVNIGPKPSQSHYFDYHNFEWTVDWVDAWNLVRTERDKLLADCDWMVVKAQETGIPISDDWLTYRESLRDITKQTNPTTIKWPRKPGK